MAPTTRTTRSKPPTNAQPSPPKTSSPEPTAPRAPPRKKPRHPPKKTPSAPNPPAKITHLILEDVNDSKIFLDMFYWPGADLTRIHILEVHLDATKPDEYADYRLARALNELHPRVDGVNPHALHAIKLVVKGNVLVTRHSYYLASPALSQHVSGALKRLATGGLAEQERAELAFKVRSSEKVVARALLGIRGVGRVVVEGKGNGKMEGRFAETVRATLVQPVGAGVVEPDGEMEMKLSKELYGEGVFASAACFRGEYRMFSAEDGNLSYDSDSLAEEKRYLVDEKEQSLDYSLQSTSRSSTRISTQKFDFHADSEHMSDAAPNKWERSVNDLGMESMVRVRAQKQDVEDGGLSNMWEEAEEYDPSLVVTGKGGTVEMGWKVR
ncbi:hypothetical protein P153DRAFT_391976 [Dothidotthia symphoricarpi CBS 119687]|uniref:Uncharacterized protein n=1 Tax=Dothidotthia symphoricarpi CBS 119687 TaxID=1392245 RepID=A0A6A6ATX1_9PLEO|nr:uncharacterized protein P153DRAFT_391976 [Dothidotthia symphoricarpi CBS 119687]KAF2134653.1 hypothetical protein P153DRAFT_391976 [Dothidotthia symphoricarpi CBS 119687]